MKNKVRTNEQALKELIKDLHPFEAMIIRERLIKIAEITLQDIDKNPSAYDTPMFSHQYFINACEKIKLHLDLE